MMWRIHFNLLFLAGLLATSCGKEKSTAETKPNVILIMADDMGYECLSANGALEYQTPVLDQLGREGIRFTHCISQPLCTPSRVKIMTGKYNYRNYSHFGYLDSEEYTFGQMMQKTGYRTAIVGKWQLNGLAYDLEGKQDSMRPRHFGFEEHCLWQLTYARNQGERFANPLIQQNGKVLPRDTDAYGPDIFCEYALDFITRMQDSSFFLYYPMVLVHEPFVPTPDSEAWSDPERRYEKDTAYFADMVSYTDKIVGRIADHLKALGLFDNTLLIFTADNGNHPTLYTTTDKGVIQGAKGNTIAAGTHVPLVISWPSAIKSAQTYDGLIEFSDFFPTLAAIAGQDIASDGESFLPLLEGNQHQPRETVFVHYDPRWGKRVNQYRNQFVQTTDYKLYQDGKLFHLPSDPLEAHPISEDNEMTSQIRNLLKEAMAHAPAWQANAD